jgi:hypothetical protein
MNLKKQILWTTLSQIVFGNQDEFTNIDLTQRNGKLVVNLIREDGSRKEWLEDDIIREYPTEYLAKQINDVNECTKTDRELQEQIPSN